MSVERSISLDRGRFINEKGEPISLPLPHVESPVAEAPEEHVTEKSLDEQLWYNPAETPVMFKQLLSENSAHESGEMTQILNRLALKAVSLPLFVREFEGQDATVETQDAVTMIPFENAQILERYLSLTDNETVDQVVLSQAIIDATVFQLVARSYVSNETDDIIMVPVSPEEYYASSVTNFSVLRRKSLGFAHLVVEENLEQLHRQETHTKPYRIMISPTQLTGGRPINSLAAALVADQKGEPLSQRAQELIKTSSGYLFTQIYDHFDT